MNDKEKIKALDRYNERLNKYGYSPKTLGWLKERQDVRFSVFSQIGALNNQSILDVGCGFGDLYGYFKNEGVEFDYLGCDINENLIEIAKNIYPDAKFIVQDFEEGVYDSNFDWVFASGIFNHKLDDNKSSIQNMLKKMFQLCNKGVAINFLSTNVDFMQENAFYTDPAWVLDICKPLTRRIALRHDYMPFEFTIFVYKNDIINHRTVFGDYDNNLKNDPKQF